MMHMMNGQDVRSNTALIESFILQCMGLWWRLVLLASLNEKMVNAKVYEVWFGEIWS